jgi:hypothetical protein
MTAESRAVELLRQAAPRLAIGGAGADTWLSEVRSFLKEHDADSPMQRSEPLAQGES